jgi:hypothetical protein
LDSFLKLSHTRRLSNMFLNRNERSGRKSKRLAASVVKQKL